MTDEQLEAIDVAVRNLICAEGLPGSDRIDIELCVKRLDYWAKCVRQATEHHLPKFHADPGKYQNSEAFYQALCLVTILQRDLGVTYNPAKKSPDVPFDTADSFIHGVLQGSGGTCATMPVVYAAVGRRLGYPIRLVKAPRHLLARWDGPGGERFNIEATAMGLACPPDDYYRTGCYEMPRIVEKGFGFLVSMTPRTEVAGFLAQRGCRYLQCGNYKESADSFVWASVMAPEDKQYQRDVKVALNKWADRLDALRPKGFPVFGVQFPPRRYPDFVPVLIERQTIFYEKLDECLSDPKRDREWWEPLRKSKGIQPVGMPKSIEVRLFQ